MSAKLQRNPRIVLTPVADRVWGLYNRDTGGYMFVDELRVRLLEIASSFASNEDLVRACGELFAGQAGRVAPDFGQRVDELFRFGALQEEAVGRSAEVLLVEPPYGLGDSGGSVSPKGLCYLSKALDDAGLGPAKILDMRSVSSRFRGSRADMVDYFTRYARSCDPAVIGVSSISATSDYALLVARLAKTLFPESYLVMGGPHASYEWRAILEGHRYVDAVVRGEGEAPFTRLVERLLAAPTGDHEFPEVPGVAWRNGRGEPVSSGWFAGVEDLDGLGWPDVYAHLLNRDDYGCFTSPHFITSRGCPFQCSFCSTATFSQRRIRYRSVASVLEEITYYWDRYGFTDFAFDDDIFTVHRKRTLALCEAIEAAPFAGRAPWGCSTRLDCIDDEVIEALYRAGCTKIFFGVESGDHEVHYRFAKGRHLLDDFKEKIGALYARGMEPRLNFILGLPGETRETVRSIVELIRDFPGIPCSFSFLSIFPGTPLADRLKELGIRFEGTSNQERYSFTAPTLSTPTLSAEEQVQAYLELQWARRRIAREARKRAEAPVAVAGAA